MAMKRCERRQIVVGNFVGNSVPFPYAAEHLVEPGFETICCTMLAFSIEHTCKQICKGQNGTLIHQYCTLSVTLEGYSQCPSFGTGYGIRASSLAQTNMILPYTFQSLLQGPNMCILSTSVPHEC